MLATEPRKHLTAMSVHLDIPAQHRHVLYVLLELTRQKAMLRLVMLVLELQLLQRVLLRLHHVYVLLDIAVQAPVARHVRLVLQVL